MVLAVDGAQSMDDVAVRQIMTAGHDGLAGSYGGERACFFREPGAGGAVDRTGHPSPAPQLCVRGVHDGRHVVLGGYVPLHTLDRHAVHRSSHYRLPSVLW